jgi:hypothetical protein
VLLLVRVVLTGMLGHLLQPALLLLAGRLHCGLLLLLHQCWQQLVMHHGQVHLVL